MPTRKLTEAEEQQTWWSMFLGILVWFLYQNTVNALASLSMWGGCARRYAP